MDESKYKVLTMIAKNLKITDVKYEVNPIGGHSSTPIRLTEEEWQACRKVLMKMRQKSGADRMTRKEFESEYTCTFDMEEE
jgi:hypothetical protein